MKQSNIERPIALIATFFVWGCVSFLFAEWLKTKVGGNFNSLNPFSWWQFIIKHWFNHPDFYRKFIFIYVLASFTIFLIFFLLDIFIFRKSAKGIKGLYGTARWATFKDIKKNGLLAKDNYKSERGAVFIGGFERYGKVEYLLYSGAEHILCFAPTRSGKFISLIAPTVLTWQHSLFAWDIKGEIWEKSSGYRHKYLNQRIIKFEPLNEQYSGACWNPLNEIRFDTSRAVMDVTQLAQMLVDDGTVTNSDPHWKESAIQFLKAVILYKLSLEVSLNNPTPSLADVALEIDSVVRTKSEFFQAMLDFEDYPEDVGTIVKAEARSLIDKPEKELGSVISTATRHLKLYLDPLVKHHTKTSDFAISEIVNSDKPVSLYVVVAEEDVDVAKPLIRLFITMLIGRLTNKLNANAINQTHKHKLLLMLDELPTLGKLDKVEDGLAYMAGFGLKAYVVVQGLDQLYKWYGQYEGFINSCHVRIAFTPNKIETAEVISKTIGDATIMKEEMTQHKGRTRYVNREIARRLIKPEEVMMLKGDVKDENDRVIEGGEMLIFIAGQYPIKGRKPLYFKDEILAARSQIKPVETDKKMFSSINQNLYKNL